MIREITSYNEKIVFDSTKPDGTLRKMMDVQSWQYLDRNIDQFKRWDYLSA